MDRDNALALLIDGNLNREQPLGLGCELEALAAGKISKFSGGVQTRF
jgi:hypothetical protein